MCSFTFVDGRHCRTLECGGLAAAFEAKAPAILARKEAQALAGEAAGKDIAYHLSGSYVSACDLSSALGRLFSAVAQGQVKPKTASTLAPPLLQPPPTHRLSPRSGGLQTGVWPTTRRAFVTWKRGATAA